MPRTTTSVIQGDTVTTVTTMTRRINVRLKIAIIKSGLSQNDIADRLHMSVFRLSRIVCGRQAPTADEEDRLAEVLGTSRRALFRAGVPS